jgi:hypothetical protein
VLAAAAARENVALEEKASAAESYNVPSATLISLCAETTSS